MSKKIKKAAKRFRKGFQHMEKIDMKPEQRALIPQFSNDVSTLLAMCKAAAPSSYGGTVSPDVPTGGLLGMSGFVSSGSKAIGTVDLASLIKSSRRFGQGFKHVSEFYVVDVVRQQAMKCQADIDAFHKELFGGESTAPEPRI